MLEINVNESTVKEMLQKAIDTRVEELAKEKYFMTMKQLENYVQMSRPTILRHLIENQMPYYRVGDRYLFKREEVDAFLDAMTEEMSITENNVLSFKGLKGGGNDG